MRDASPVVISLCLCLCLYMSAAMTLGACERAGHGDGAGAAVRFQGQVSEETALPEPEPEPDLYYNGPPMARARVPLASAAADAASVLRTSRWLHEIYMPEGGYTLGEDRRPYEALAFEEILKRVDAEAVFEDLLRDATQAGQFYALGGLFVVNRARFQEAVRSYRPLQPWTWFSFGCGTDHLEAHWLLVQLQAGNLPYLILPEGYEGDPVFLD